MDLVGHAAVEPVLVQAEVRGESVDGCAAQVARILDQDVAQFPETALVTGACRALRR